MLLSNQNTRVLVGSDSFSKVVIGPSLPGPPGKDGTNAAGGNVFRFAQGTPLQVWTFTHSLGVVPASVQVFDVNGFLVPMPDVTVTSTGCQVVNAAPETGSVVLIG